MGIATTIGGESLRQKLLGITHFAMRSPIIKVDGGDAVHCLEHRMVYEDMPMLIVGEDEETGEELVFGMAKSRSAHEGCVKTPALIERYKASKRKVPETLKPSVAEIVWGGSDIMPGMSLVEIEQIGLNIGGGLGMTPGLEFTAPGLMFGAYAEYNMARWLSISEFYATANLNFGYYPDHGGAYFDFGLGALMRFYSGGSFFIDAALSLDLNLHSVGAGFSGTPASAIGFHLSPELIFRWALGFRLGVAGGFLDMGPWSQATLTYTL